jgi:hypothetical protein
MKKLLGLLTAVLISASLLNAEDKKEEAKGLSGGVSIFYDSSADFRGKTANEEINASVGVNKEIFGLDFGLEGTVGVRDGLEDERRLNLYTSLDLSFLDLEVGVVNYDNNIVVGDDTEIYVEAGAEIILNPTVIVYYSPDREVTTLEGGISQDISIKKLNLEATANVGTTEMADERVNYYKLGVSTTYEINDRTHAFVGVDFVNFDEIALDDFDIGVYAGVSHRF